MVVVSASACGFEGSGASTAPVCEPEQRTCEGRVRRTCGPDGQWDAAAEATCEAGCSEGACITASYLPHELVKACMASTAPALRVQGAVTLEASTTSDAPVFLQCADGCAPGASTRIDSQPRFAGNGASIVWFCLSELDLSQGGLQLSGAGRPVLADALAFVVTGSVRLAGKVSARGGDAAFNAGGLGGPGGGRGGGLSNVDGQAGVGLGGGPGGDQNGTPNNFAASGGGGGGNLTAGGGGGTGRSPNGAVVSVATGGGAAISSEEGAPLVGGGGGGGGGDGSCGGDCGWPGGGGGGALLIFARDRIEVSAGGGIDGAGGNGLGGTGAGGNGGGGGGGAGGTLVLEAPQLSIQGALHVDGGTGGQSNAGAGGAGATGATGPSPGISAGATAASNGHGGSGGGGAGGRIRLHAANATCPPGASPAASCSTGKPRPAP